MLAILALLAWLGPLLGRRPEALSRLTRHGGWVGAALVLHVGALAAEGVVAGRVPLDSMRFGLGALSLWVMLGWLYLRLRPRMELLEALLLGLGVVLLAGGQLAPGGGPPDRLATLWFPFHVSLILAGLLGFAVSFTLSVLFLVVRARLKARRLRGIARLPSLETLDKRNYQSMALGFVALTAGMAVGGMWAATHPDSSMGPDATIWGTLLLWVWYAAGLHLRLVSGWRGRLAAIFGVGGFAGLGFFVLFASVVLQGWHGGGG
ncbi:MAG: cytochrome c biogenesis protein CcsA [Myxococcota bacterium]|nr:cytochrome c biogenesis protein CcsA [Myxococcota bacterium]